MDMSNASDEKQLAQEGFVHVRSCPQCKLLRAEIKRLRKVAKTNRETAEKFRDRVVELNEAFREVDAIIKKG